MMRPLASYDAAEARYILEAGDYIVRIGGSSRDTVPAAAVRLRETVIVRRVSNVGGQSDFFDWKPENSLPIKIPEELPVLEADPDAFRHLTWPEPVDPSLSAKEIVSKLTDEQLAYLCVGNFKDGMGVASIIGEASQKVAGAAGETTARITGVPVAVMADGPAGLRLSMRYTRDETGVHPVGSTRPAGLDEFFGPVQKFFMGLMQKKPTGTIYTQYCTALPIGTALAQSWNLALCEECGDIVGAEMERYGIHLWLAPAFNIHRSPLCGRNYEYYSEDPLLSGKTGAAVTRGVQRHAGRGATIKHFCCNNQETNRYASNSVVSERALREIYLRGFQICVKESAPSAMMTSYNLLNGIHTSERGDLLQTLVRDEWGYDGLIMTDWVVTAMGSKGKYRPAKAVPTIKAGNSLFMPGGPADYKALVKALQGKDKGFSLTRAEVVRCAEWVVDTALRLAQR